MTLRTWAWMIGLATVSLYLYATYLAFCLLYMHRRFHAWVRVWVAFTVACCLLSVQRILTVLFAPRILLYRDLIALAVAAALVYMGWEFVRILHNGSAHDD
jgi:hypothetical protein